MQMCNDLTLKRIKEVLKPNSLLFHFFCHCFWSKAVAYKKKNEKEDVLQFAPVNRV